MLGILVILSLAWTAFVKPEKERAEALKAAGIENISALPQYQASDPGESQLSQGLRQFWAYTGFRNATSGHLIMMVVGLIFIFLAIKYEYEPLLLIPIGTGILIGNIPFFTEGGMNLQVGIYQQGSVLNYLYFGVLKGIYPPLIFLGIGAMTDFSSLISNPRLLLLGAAAQIGIFVTFLGAIALGFAKPEAAAIGIIGGADGPTAIFLSSRLANGVNILADGTTVKNLIGPIAIAAYSYMALVPVIQPPIMRLLTSKKERLIRMKPPRAVTKTEKILFPIFGLLTDLFHFSKCASFAWYAFLRQYPEGIRCHQEACGDSQNIIDRHCYYNDRTNSRSIDTG